MYLVPFFFSFLLFLFFRAIEIDGKKERPTGMPIPMNDPPR